MQLMQSRSSSYYIWWMKIFQKAERKTSPIRMLPASIAELIILQLTILASEFDLVFALAESGTIQTN